MGNFGLPGSALLALSFPMAHAVPLRARGVVVEVLRDGAGRVELPNGHRCIARAPADVLLAKGAAVTVEFHPYDLSRGRIVPVG
jgi:translation initiation factor IF-1